ncbi:MAG: hypothetical protein E7566_06560 [Ruminococcaceae bacterium]|nr:hypothetical protein [Oscillospiraceae bacterium]
MKEVIAVSGARCSKFGLHLGHYSGCFIPLSAQLLNKYDHYFFVVYDSLTTKNDENIYKFVSQIYALADSLKLRNVHVVLESQIAPLIYKIRYGIENIVTVEQLKASYRVNHRNMHLPASQSGRTISDFMFPLNQAAIAIAYNAKYTCMNDDNIRIVELTRDIIRKINNFQNTNISNHTLVTGYKPHLFGFNYLKMCNRNNNAIYFSDEIKSLDLKIHQLFSHKRYFEKYPNQYDLFKSTNEYYYNDAYLPVYFYKALFPHLFREEFYLLDKEMNILFEIDLKKRIIGLIGLVNSKYIEYIKQIDFIKNRMKSDFAVSYELISKSHFIE